MIARKFQTLYVACISFVGERWAKETLTQEASRVPRELPSREQGAPGNLSRESWELILATVTAKEDSTTSSVTAQLLQPSAACQKRFSEEFGLSPSL